MISCPNYYHPSLSEDHFFPFPKNRSVAKIWTEKCGVAADHPTTAAKVCSDHFKWGDYADDNRTILKPDAIPRDNLGWMVGMPEVKIVGARPEFDQIKEAVNTNEQLKAKFEKLILKQKVLQEKSELYKKKINNVDKEICRLTGLIEKIPLKKNDRKMMSNLIYKVFSQAQINMLMGKKKVVWSYDDMAMAFTLRHVGSRECYLYLKNTLNMPLPALSALQRWSASNKLKYCYD